jgi:hypothetical protein
VLSTPHSAIQRCGSSEGLAGVAEELADIEADAAGADDRRTGAHFDPAQQHVQVADHLGVVGAGKSTLRGVMPVASTTSSKPARLAASARVPRRSCTPVSASLWRK